MKQEHNNVDGEALSEANQCIALGVGVGGLGAGAALVLGATCPLCVIAAPRAGDEFDLLGVELVQDRVVRHPAALIPIHNSPGLSPEALGVGRQIRRQTDKRIVRRGGIPFSFFGRPANGFRTGAAGLSRDQE